MPVAWIIFPRVLDWSYGHLNPETEESLMKKHLAALFLSVAFPAIAFGQVSFYELATNETFEISSLDTADMVFALIENDRSYCCQIYHVGQSNIVPKFSSITPNSGALADLSSRGQAAPWLGAGNNSVDSRRCFRAQVTSPVNRTFITLGLAANSSPVPNARLLCKDTTLYGGFNTAVTDFNFIEITNTLIASTDLTNSVVVNIKANGTISGNQVLNTTITVQPGQRMDVDVHSVAANDFGPVTITHNGPQGSIRAVNVQYRIVTQSPLDFEPVLSVPFREGN